MPHLGDKTPSRETVKSSLSKVPDRRGYVIVPRRISYLPKTPNRPKLPQKGSAGALKDYLIISENKRELSKELLMTLQVIIPAKWPKINNS